MSQVSAVSPVRYTPQPQRQNFNPQKEVSYKKADYIGALGTAGLWGTAWGAGEYIFNRKPFLNEGQISESFKNAIDAGLKELKDVKVTELDTNLKNIYSAIEKCTSHDELSNIFAKFKNELPKLEKDKIDEAINAIKNRKDLSLDEFKNIAKDTFNCNGKHREYIQGIYDSCCDKAGKLVHDAKNISKEKFDLVKNTAKKFRTNSAFKSALTFAAMTATILCIFEFFRGRKAKKEAQKAAQNA